MPQIFRFDEADGVTTAVFVMPKLLDLSVIHAAGRELIEYAAQRHCPRMILDPC